MKNKFFNSSFSNIYSRPKKTAEVVSQILYGEKFKILKKNRDWVKVKTNFDNYVGFIKKEKFKDNFKPSKKVFKLKTRIYKKKKNKFLKTENFLYFGSGVEIKNNNLNYIEFEKNSWIKKNDTKKIDHLEKNFKRILKMFLNSKYLWGGKTSDGIDCSALIQIFFYYNRIFFPRDSGDQMKFCKKKNFEKFAKGDIIFWKGHVGVCINKSKFIHAYGPKKKVVIMNIKFTISLIKKTAKLVVKKISNINNY